MATAGAQRKAWATTQQAKQREYEELTRQKAEYEQRAKAVRLRLVGSGAGKEPLEKEMRRLVEEGKTLVRKLDRCKKEMRQHARPNDAAAAKEEEGEEEGTNKRRAQEEATRKAGEANKEGKEAEECTEDAEEEHDDDDDDDEDTEASEASEDSSEEEEEEEEEGASLAEQLKQEEVKLSSITFAKLAKEGEESQQRGDLTEESLSARQRRLEEKEKELQRSHKELVAKMRDVAKGLLQRERKLEKQKHQLLVENRELLKERHRLEDWSKSLRRWQEMKEEWESERQLEELKKERELAKQGKTERLLKFQSFSRLSASARMEIMQETREQLTGSSLRLRTRAKSLGETDGGNDTITNNNNAVTKKSTDKGAGGGCESSLAGLHLAVSPRHSVHELMEEEQGSSSKKRKSGSNLYSLIRNKDKNSSHDCIRQDYAEAAQNHSKSTKKDITELSKAELYFTRSKILSEIKTFEKGSQLNSSSTSLDIPRRSRTLSSDEAAKILQRRWRQRRKPCLLYALVQQYIASEESVPGKQRNMVYFEILHKERDYVEMMEMVLKCYMEPMRALSLSEGACVTLYDVAAIFGNWESLAHINKELLAQLEERMSGWPAITTVGDVFVTMLPLMRMYVKYYLNFDTSSQTFDRCKKSKPFAAFLQRCQAASKRMDDLPQFLIAPVQRLPRYQLLLENLFKLTPEQHVDYSNLQKAIKQMKALIEWINEQTVLADKRKRFLEVMDQISGDSFTLMKLRTPGHYQFIFKSDITEIKETKKSYVGVLLSHHLLLTSRKLKLKKVFALQEDSKCQPLSDNEERKHAFTLETQEQTLTLSASSSEERRTWVHHLRKAIKNLEQPNKSLSLAAPGSLSNLYQPSSLLTLSPPLSPLPPASASLPIIEDIKEPKSTPYFLIHLLSSFLQAPSCFNRSHRNTFLCVKKKHEAQPLTEDRFLTVRSSNYESFLWIHP
ncbi:hypothetical protein QOT17_001086 [Balamuthia mandrillaris]